MEPTQKPSVSKTSAGPGPMERSMSGSTSAGRRVSTPMEGSMSGSTTAGKTSSGSSGAAFRSPHGARKVSTHRVRLQEKQLLAQAVRSKGAMDKEARRQVCLTLCGAGLVVASFTIAATTFLWNVFQATEAMEVASLDIRRRVADGVLDEVAQTLHPVHDAVRRLTEKAKVGTATGDKIWPPTLDSLLNHREEVLGEIWPELELDLHLRSVATNGSEREHVPIYGITALLAYQEDFETPATSMEECAHVMQTGIWMTPEIHDGVLQVSQGPEYTSFQSHVSTDESGAKSAYRTIHWFNSESISLRPYGPWRIQPKFCGEDMMTLWGGSAAKREGAFNDIAWFGPEPDLYKQLFANAPLYDEDGRYVGVIGASVSTYYSVSPVLVHTVKDNADLTRGGHLAVVTESGALIGDSEGVSSGGTIMNFMSEVPENSTLGFVARLVQKKSGGSYCAGEHTVIDEEDMLIDVIPFYAEDYGLPPLPERWCVIMSLPRENIYNAVDRAQEIKIWSLSGNAAMFACAILLLIVSLYLALTSDRGLKRERLRGDLRKVLQAVREVHSLSSPMALLPASTFLQLERLDCHEAMRDKGLLKVLDSIGDVLKFKENNMIIFLSHQWLSCTFPDTEDGIQLRAMKGAIETMLSDPSRTKEVYIWCDFISIAQRHTRMQQAAITSLPVYASMADKFIMVAPPAAHKELQCECTLETYSERGWCRAEMLAKACGSGIEEMYSCTDTKGTLTAITVEDLSRLSLNIFEGRFSYQSDVEDLVKPALGLYSLVLRERHLPHMQLIHAHIEGEKDRFFPVDYHNRISNEKVELFGKQLIPLLEKYVENGGATWVSWASGVALTTSPTGSAATASAPAGWNWESTRSKSFQE